VARSKSGQKPSMNESGSGPGVTFAWREISLNADREEVAMNSSPSTGVRQIRAIQCQR
jgi:hypothetical protein